MTRSSFCILDLRIGQYAFPQSGIEVFFGDQIDSVAAEEL
jgi:hypothetical protein